MKKIISLLFCLLLLISCSDDDDQTKEPQIVVDSESVSLKMGEEKRVGFKILNPIPDSNSLTVSIENEEIASLSSLNENYDVTGVAPGETYMVIKYNEIEKRIKITVGNTYDLEAYYEKFCNGYRVKDTTDLKVLSFQNKDDFTYLSGARGDKLWIGKFDPNSKVQTAEYITNKAISFERRVNYSGEYKKLFINTIHINSLFETTNGWVADLRFYDKNDLPSQLYRLLVFNDKEETIDYFHADFNNMKNEYLIKWYDDSFLRRIDMDNIMNSAAKYTCFKPNGDVIVSGPTPLLAGRIYYPINYDDFILLTSGIKYDEVNKQQEQLFEIQITSISGAKGFTIKEFSYDMDQDDWIDTYDSDLINIANEVWTFRVYFTYESGKRTAHNYEVDVKNNSIQEIDP